VVDTTRTGPPDPYAIADLATDVRPPSYAANYAMLAAQHADTPQPISVCTRERPDWLKAVTELLSLEKVELDQALQHYAAQAAMRGGTQA